MSEIPKFIETYQTLIVGLMGFVGVIATLVFNSKLSRDLRKDEIEHERNSVRQALITELETIKVTLKGKSEREKTDNDWLVPKTIETGIYDVLLPKISLLSQTEIKHVLHAYLLVKEISQRLGVLVQPGDRDGAPEGYFYIRNNLVDAARGVHSAFTKEIDLAIASLTKELSNSS